MKLLELLRNEKFEIVLFIAFCIALIPLINYIYYRFNDSQTTFISNFEADKVLIRQGLMNPNESIFYVNKSMEEAG